MTSTFTWQVFHHGAPAAIVSRRELDVLPLVVEGWSNKEIAAELCISERTVKFHVSNLFRKFRVNRRLELIRKLQ
jgi:DNA-binding NarL/FixJ family response regulator